VAAETGVFVTIGLAGAAFMAGVTLLGIGFAAATLIAGLATYKAFKIEHTEREEYAKEIGRWEERKGERELGKFGKILGHEIARGLRHVDNAGEVPAQGSGKTWQQRVSEARATQTADKCV
jgi:hypothetical protein